MLRRGVAVAGARLRRSGSFWRARAARVRWLQLRGETEDRLWDLTDQMTPEDGVFWIYNTDERQTMAFTAFGIEPLKELVTDQPCVFQGRWASISWHRGQPFPASGRLADWFMEPGSMRPVERFYRGGALAQAFFGEGQSASVMDEPVEDRISKGRIADGFMPVLDRELADDLTSGWNSTESDGCHAAKATGACTTRFLPCDLASNSAASARDKSE